MHHLEDNDIFFANQHGFQKNHSCESQLILTVEDLAMNLDHGNYKTHIWRGRQDSNPGHIGGRQALSPLRHPCSQERSNQMEIKWI